MSTAHDIRRHLLKARHELEAAQDRLDSAYAPGEVRARVDDVLRRVTVAEGEAALWAES